MDELRARAYLDLLLGTDSRPRQDSGAGRPGGRRGRGATAREAAAREAAGSGPQDPPGPAAPPGTGVLPAGFAGTVHLIAPLVTLLGLVDRPAEIPGLGPVDPALARDLARAAARNPKTTWCVTVTDEQGHAIGHGCARPEPKSHHKHREKHQKPGPRDGRDPPGGTGARDGPGFAFTAANGTTARRAPATAGTGPGGCPPGAGDRT